MLLAFFDKVFQTGQRRSHLTDMLSHPAIANALDGDWIEVVPTVAPLAAYDNQIGSYQDVQVLHHGGSAEFGFIASDDLAGR